MTMKNRLLLLPFTVLGTALMANSPGVLVGWNTFEPNDGATAVSDTTPDTVAVGFSGAIGTAVVSGGRWSAAGINLNNSTYGSEYGMGKDVGADSGVRLETGTSSNQRLDIKLTNNSAYTVSINKVHLDAQPIYWGPTMPTTEAAVIRVSHLSIESDLNDAFTGRNLGELSVDPPAVNPDTNTTTYEVDQSVAAMTDITLAPGESAAFRIELLQPTAGNCAFKIDNVAVSGTEGTIASYVAVGWNEFAPNDGTNRADDNVPNTVASGFSGILGINVNSGNSSQGGGVSSSAAQDHTADTTYGSTFEIDPLEIGAASGVLVNTYSNNNRYVDIQVTNSTGGDIIVDSVHADVKMNFGNDGTVFKISHFGNAGLAIGTTDLEDSFNYRALLTENIAAGDFSWHQLDASTSAMADTVLADGEKAAFRVFITATTSASAGRIDNVAIGVRPVASSPVERAYSVNLVKDLAIDEETLDAGQGEGIHGANPQWPYAWENRLVGEDGQVQGSGIWLDQRNNAGSVGNWGAVDSIFRAGLARYPATASETGIHLSNLLQELNDYRVYVYLASYDPGADKVGITDGRTTFWVDPTAGPDPDGPVTKTVEPFFEITAISDSGTTPILGEANQTYNLTTLAGNGAGTGAAIDVVRDVDGALASVTLVDGGSGFGVGEVITIQGTLIGGVDGFDDLFVTVDAVNKGEAGNYVCFGSRTAPLKDDALNIQITSTDASAGIGGFQIVGTSVGGMSLVSAVINGSGEYVLSIEGDPTVSYEVVKSIDLATWADLVPPVTVTPSGVPASGTLVVPSSEMGGPRQFFRVQTETGPPAP
jgi:hypothetical protein